MFPPYVCRFSPKRCLASASAVCLCFVVYSLVRIDHYGENIVSQTDKRHHRLEVNNTSEEDSPIVNETWVKMRSELLRENRVSKVFLFTYMRGGSSLFAELFNLDPQRSVLFFEPLDAFYQSYAGFFPNGIPLTLLYDRNLTERSVGEREVTEISDYLESLLTCRIDQLPVETFAHNYLGYSTAFKRPAECMDRKYSKMMIGKCINPIKRICGNGDAITRNMFIAIANKCPEIIRALKVNLPDTIHPTSYTFTDVSRTIDYIVNKTNVTKSIEGFSEVDEQRLSGFVYYHVCKAKAKFILANCMDTIESTCKRARLIALKVIRSRMKDLEMLIQRMPDIHVLYYTRDPRAIVVSRLHLPFPLMFSTNRSVIEESMLLCRRMWEDFKAKKWLERKYPGSITTIRYEDFVRDLNGTALKVYEKVGYEPSSEFHRWLDLTRRGTSGNDGPYGIRRPNATASIDRWRKRVNVQEEAEMSRHCSQYLMEQGYEVY